MKAIKIGTLCMSTILLTVMTGCGSKEQTETQRGPIAVNVMTVNANSVNGDYKYSGTAEEESGTNVSFMVGGTLKTLNLRVGDRVRRGQLIAVVDGSTVKSSYDIAHATLKQAEDAYARMKQLHDKGSLPDIKWVEAESQLSQARSAEEIAKKNLKDCSLYSPADGVVSEKFVEVGQNVAPGVPVVKIANTSVLNVRVYIPESEMPNVKIGQRADIIVPALNDSQFAGQITEKGVIADPISRSYAVKIRISGSAQGLLPGMVAKVNIGHSAGGDAIVIPASLLQLGDDNSYNVWVVDGDKAVRRKVTCGEFTASGVVVTDGLKTGDKVIVKGQQKVCNGTKVEVR